MQIQIELLMLLYGTRLTARKWWRIEYGAHNTSSWM
jgi:hypothetical protein